MITKEDYLKAQKLIADYELSNGIKPIVIKSLPPDWCWVKAKIVEDGDHLNDGKAMIISVPRIDDPTREAILWVWKYNVRKEGGNVL